MIEFRYYNNHPFSLFHTLFYNHHKIIDFTSSMLQYLNFYILLPCHLFYDVEVVATTRLRVMLDSMPHYNHPTISSIEEMD